MCTCVPQRHITGSFPRLDHVSLKVSLALWFGLAIPRQWLVTNQSFNETHTQRDLLRTNFIFSSRSRSSFYLLEHSVGEAATMYQIVCKQLMIAAPSQRLIMSVQYRFDGWIIALTSGISVLFYATVKFEAPTFRLVFFFGWWWWFSFLTLIFPIAWQLLNISRHVEVVKSEKSENFPFDFEHLFDWFLMDIRSFVSSPPLFVSSMILLQVNKLSSQKKDDFFCAYVWRPKS